MVTETTRSSTRVISSYVQRNTALVGSAETYQLETIKLSTGRPAKRGRALEEVSSSKTLKMSRRLSGRTCRARISNGSDGRPSEYSPKEQGGVTQDMEDFQPNARFTKEETFAIRSSLLKWYDINHRVLPWRQSPPSLHPLELKTGVHATYEVDLLPEGLHQLSAIGEDPQARCQKGEKERPSGKQQRAYEVWVSEMMLQQTQVVTVIQYYKRWMEKWPTLYDLAQASQEEVNDVWAGLGYYRRARFLLEGAKKIVQEYEGIFPETAAELLRVPGIGDYTAGAVSSIAFGQPAPVVDGNVVRVLSRLRAIASNPKASSTIKLFWALAKELVESKRPGDLNQALMELGATVCTRTKPSCNICPVASNCEALSLVSRCLTSASKVPYLVTDFPAKVLKVPPRREFVSVCVLEMVSNSALSMARKPESCTDTQVLLVQRPKHGLLAGLWEFPSVPHTKLTECAKVQRGLIDRYLKNVLGCELGEKNGITVKARESLGSYVHVFSHIRMHMNVEWLLVSPSEETSECSGFGRQSKVPIKWVEACKIQELGLTTSVRKNAPGLQAAERTKQSWKSEKSKEVMCFLSTILM